MDAIETYSQGAITIVKKFSDFILSGDRNGFIQIRSISNQYQLIAPEIQINNTKMIASFYDLQAKGEHLILVGDINSFIITIKQTFYKMGRLYKSTSQNPLDMLLIMIELMEELIEIMEIGMNIKNKILRESFKMKTMRGKKNCFQYYGFMLLNIHIKISKQKQKYLNGQKKTLQFHSENQKII